MNILNELKQRFAASLNQFTADTSSAIDLIRPAQDVRFGDYQANCAMPLGKQLGQSPRDVAQQIVEHVQLDDLCETPEIAGPGFINVRLKTAWIGAQLRDMAVDARLGVPVVKKPKTFVIDYSSPNVAKSMHVGHIRSTVIGDALSRILRFVGHQVVSDNHLGDWGTQFGMIIYGYRHFLKAADYEENPLPELGRVYREVRKIMDYYEAVDTIPKLEERIEQNRLELTRLQSLVKQNTKDKKAAKSVKRAEQRLTDSETELTSIRQKIRDTENNAEVFAVVQNHADIRQAVLRETAKLHEGDQQSIAIWKEVLPKCRAEVQRLYDRLDIQFDVELGESFYHDRLASVVKSLTEKGLAKESDGAICVFLDGFAAPMIIRKHDGAFLYATTDLATIAYRMQTWTPDAILYVVDFRQGEHFQKLFAAAKRWGYDQVDLRHIEFGTVLGEDGRPFKTRSGDTVGLESLLDAAVERAGRVVSENDDQKPKGPELSPDQRHHIANVVGHAAIKYADLAQNRASDYVFSEEKMVALKGNTATYLQYSYARAVNILHKGNVEAQSIRDTDSPIQLDQPKERQLGLALLRFPEACDEVLVDFRPNQLTSYLYELATMFSEFYEACPVLKADSDQQRVNRLRLCDLVAQTLRLGLSLLGIQVVEKM